MRFIDDPKQSKKLSLWLIRIVAACLVIYLALRYIDVVGAAVGYIVNLISPLILGFMLALILNVPLRPIEGHLFPKTKKERLQKLRRPLAVIISILLVAGVFIFILCLIVPELVSALTVIVEGLIQLAKGFSEWSSEIPFLNTVVENVETSLRLNYEELQKKAMEWIKNTGPDVAAQVVGTFGGIGSAIFNFVVGLVFSIYILLDKESLKSQAKRLIRAWIPEKNAEYMIHAAEISNVTFRSFVTGQLTEAVILGSLCMIGMLILRIPYAPMVGALIGVTALVPIFGALVGTVIGAVMIVSEDPLKAVIFVIFLLILQQVEGNLIYPKVVGAKIGLPGMWVLAAVTVGGSLGGAIGMLLGVPVFSVLYTLINEATEKREQNLSLKNDPERNDAQNENDEDGN